MKDFKFFLFIILSGLLYSLTGSVLAFILSGIGISVLIARGKYPTAVSGAAVSLLLCGFSEMSLMASYLLAGVLPGTAIGIGYKYRLKLPTLMIAPSLCFAGQWVYVFSAYKRTNGTNLFEDFAKATLENAQASLSTAVSAAGIEVESATLESVIEIMKQMMQVVTQLTPSMLIIFSCFMALIIILLSKNAAYGSKVTPTSSFSEIYAPNSIIIMLGLCIIGFFAKTNALKFFLANISVIMMSFFILCGVSVLDFFFRKKVPGSVARAVIYIFGSFVGFLLLPQLIIPLLVMIGTADMAFDFRRIRRTYRNGNEK